MSRSVIFSSAFDAPLGESAEIGSKEKQAEIVKMCKPSSLPADNDNIGGGYSENEQPESFTSLRGETIIKEESALSARKEHTITKPMNFIPGVHYTLNSISYQVLTAPDKATLVVKNLVIQEIYSQLKSILWTCWAEATLLLSMPHQDGRERTAGPLKTRVRSCLTPGEKHRVIDLHYEQVHATSWLKKIANVYKRLQGKDSRDRQ